MLLLETPAGLFETICRLIPCLEDHVHEHFESANNLVLVLLAKNLKIMLALCDVLPQILIVITKLTINLFKSLSLMHHVSLQTDDFAAVGILAMSASIRHLPAPALCLPDRNSCGESVYHHGRANDIQYHIVS